MWIVRVKDRGRDLAVHEVESRDEAVELVRVYELLGYAPEKMRLITKRTSYRRRNVWIFSSPKTRQA